MAWSASPRSSAPACGGRPQKRHTCASQWRSPVRRSCVQVPKWASWASPSRLSSRAGSGAQGAACAGAAAGGTSAWGSRVTMRQPAWQRRLSRPASGRPCGVCPHQGRWSTSAPACSSAARAWPWPAGPITSPGNAASWPSACQPVKPAKVRLQPIQRPCASHQATGTGSRSNAAASTGQAGAGGAGSGKGWGMRFGVPAGGGAARRAGRLAGTHRGQRSMRDRQRKV